MTYYAYQSAVDAVKDALITALNNDEETNTLSEIWRHYLGLRSIADKASADFVEEEILTFNRSQEYWEEDGISLTGNPIGAADTVAISSGLLGGMGQDIITFS